jgi:glycerol-3-phosphate dehydrogenase subunit C
MIELAMTTTYFPAHPDYLDEADVRGELTRVFDICGACRSCVDLCDTFPILFEMLDRQVPQDVPFPVLPDAGRLTPADQDRVVDSCVQCTACVVRCPYTPDVHPWAVDVPRLVWRAKAMQHDAGIRSMRSRLAGQFSGRPRLVAKLARLLPVTAERIAGAPFVRPRFSEWFDARIPGSPVDRAGAVNGAHNGAVTVVPTCVVEYHEPRVGVEFVESADANGIDCVLTTAGCCGAPWLYSGDIDHVAKVARRNVKTLAAEVRRGTDVVVLDNRCRHVIRVGYVDHVGGADAELVAAHTFDSIEHAEHLEQIRRDRSP